MGRPPGPREIRGTRFRMLFRNCFKELFSILVSEIRLRSDFKNRFDA